MFQCAINVHGSVPREKDVDAFLVKTCFRPALCVFRGESLCLLLGFLSPSVHSTILLKYLLKYCQ